MSFNEIAKVVKERYRYSTSWTRRQLQVLEKRKKAKRRKDGASYVYSMK